MATVDSYYGYIRVSTARQGEGVSLQQQKAAIEHYAQKHNLDICQWFEEQETAAKTGRPIFSEMIEGLEAGRVRGVVIHKIDRSARNLRDWSDLGELIDHGIEVHFANESLDLNSRGGRLSADIQAVVAADYVRNLREETKKGFYGRLKQGLYPMPAPTGYLDNGTGQPKTPDPKTAPLIRKAFGLYATGRYSLESLSVELKSLGLRRRSGTALSVNRLSELLNNPFYMGIIRIQARNETYSGIHEPLVSRDLFGRVQRILHCKINTAAIKHDFLYRRRLTCKHCTYSLIGERQKGHVYYRCQTPKCPTTCVREEIVDQAVLEAFQRLRFSELERGWFRSKVAQMKSHEVEEREKVLTTIDLHRSQVIDRLNRLTDAYIDRLIEKELFEERKSALLVERADVEQRLADWQGGNRSPADELLNFLERAEAAYLAYKRGLPEERRDLLEALTSNRVVSGKTPEITLLLPFQEVANRPKYSNGCPSRDTPRTWERLMPRLVELLALKMTEPSL